MFLRDVASVVDGSDIVTSYAFVNGRRTVYVPVTKRSDASTFVGGQPRETKSGQVSKRAAIGR